MKTLIQEKRAGLSYSVAAILPSVLFLLLQAVLHFAGVTEYETTQWYLYCQYLISQVAFFLVMLVVGFGGKLSLSAFGIKKCAPRYYILALLAGFGLFFSLSQANALFLEGLKQIFPGYNPESVPLPSTQGWGFLGVLLVVGVLPAIMEEAFFRGVLFGGLRPFGEVFAIFLSGALFSLFHMNPMQTVYQFCCGCVFALIASRSGSILPTMLVHFCNNAAVVVLTHFGMDSFAGAWLLPVSLLSLVALVVSVVLLARERVPKAQGTGRLSMFFLTAGVGIFLCVLTWISTLVTYL